MPDAPASALLARWCAIPSASGDPAGLARMREVLRAQFEPLGARTWDDPVGPAGEAVLHVASLAREGPPVLLVGHYDTVPTPPVDGAVPVRLDAERVHARGAADMKGGLVVMLGALRRLEGGPGPRPGWHVMLVPDEEVGSPGSCASLAEAAARADAGLVFEPALPDGALVRGRKGTGTLVIDVAGTAAHAGRDPEAGRSAVVALAELVLAVEGMRDLAPGLLVNVGVVRGGVAANVVPATARAEVDVRADRAADAAELTGALTAAARGVEARRGVRVSLSGGLNRPPRVVDDATERLFARYAGEAAALGHAITWRDVGGGSDANHLSAAGLPTLDGLGAVGGDLHGDDEYALVASLDARAELAARLLRGLARRAGA